MIQNKPHPEIKCTSLRWCYLRRAEGTFFHWTSLTALMLGSNVTIRGSLLSVRHCPLSWKNGPGSSKLMKYSTTSNWCHSPKHKWHEQPDLEILKANEDQKKEFSERNHPLNLLWAPNREDHIFCNTETPPYFIAVAICGFSGATSSLSYSLLPFLIFYLFF